MGKKSYIIPEVDVHKVEGDQLLAGFSEKPNSSTPVVNDCELDANTSSFEEDILPSKGLWDED